MLDNEYMKITNKRITSLAMILVIMVVLVLSITNNERFKNIPIKSTYEIDKLLEVCYINCNSNKEYSYNSILVDLEAIQQKVDMVAEENRQAELAVEVEQARIAEAERKERARLAKVELDKQREIRREEKKKVQMNSRIASRSNEYKGANENIGTFNVSWYGANCTGCSGITSSGISVQNTITYNGYGVAAADWSVIPAYSVIEVEGYGRYIILDKGGAIKGSKLDLLTTSEAKSNEYGRQQLKVTVLKWGSN